MPFIIYSYLLILICVFVCISCHYVSLWLHVCLSVGVLSLGKKLTGQQACVIMFQNLFINLEFFACYAHFYASQIQIMLTRLW